MNVAGDYTGSEHKRERLLWAFQQSAPCSTNDAIDLLYQLDSEKGIDYLIEQGWRYYVHINKQTSELHRRNLIRKAGFQTNRIGQQETVWGLVK